jgi:hypothetical protein
MEEQCAKTLVADDALEFAEEKKWDKKAENEAPTLAPWMRSLIISSAKWNAKTSQANTNALQRAE